jgi:hypothetical protein
MPYTVAIDLDGTILDWEKGEPYRLEKFGPLMRGARVAMESMFNAGHRIIIHTCRVNPEVNDGVEIEMARDTIADALQKHMLPYHEIWIGAGKPVADLYIDDRAVRFTTWDNVRAFLEAEERDDG